MFVTELEGGTLTSSAAGCAWCLVRPRVLGCGGLERDRVGWVVVGTLLGPEGTGDCFFWRASCPSYRPVSPGLAVGDVG